MSGRMVTVPTRRQQMIELLGEGARRDLAPPVSRRTLEKVHWTDGVQVNCQNPKRIPLHRLSCFSNQGTPRTSPRHTLRCHRSEPETSHLNPRLSRGPWAGMRSSVRVLDFPALRYHSMRSRLQLPEFARDRRTGGHSWTRLGFELGD